ncbi:hypothetical protein Tco_1546471 [Tanacetum coccineum]
MKKSLGEDASKQRRIDDAYVEATFIDETLNDARNKNNKISNSKVEDDKETALEVKKCLDISSCQNRRDLPRDILLDSVVDLRYEKRSKSENKGTVPTEMELVLEQT